MAALTAENFAALQSLLKVSGSGGESLRPAFVPEILDEAGVRNKWALAWSQASKDTLSKLFERRIKINTELSGWWGNKTVDLKALHRRPQQSLGMAFRIGALG